ncbi:uncharacterized protein LOC129241396 [Anastrepha obliqua]|uniref:uncharacterized protein LOC129241396 n=1 Tax=Anastrepha obliqua TaxID=95512 RepID=UPI00240932C6|nr:uncharacterized protein LOC129241396 [Anastrepha obliqua]
MAESKPIEHEPNESDEDCEVYFLKPVNEYNIVEKIKEANKVLFEEVTNGDPQAPSSDDIDTASDLIADAEAGASLRKVTFAPNLETYEPDNALLETLQLTREFEEAVAEAKELDRTLTTICEYQTIVEEATNPSGEEKVDINVDAADQRIAETLLSKELTETDTAAMQAPLDEAPISNKPAHLPTKSDVEDDIVEEICEEIIVMDMENEQTLSDTQNTQAINPRRMVKMRTFDCAEEDSADTVETEQDNKSLVNLLTSDGEEECCSAVTFDISVDNSDLDVDDIDADISTNEVDAKTNADTDEEVNFTNNEVTHTEGYGDDENTEDDDLSIIVASYLTDDFDQKSLSSGRLKPTKKSHLLAPLSKGFSFCRKPFTHNAIGTTCADSAENGSSNSATSRVRRQHLPPPEVTDLKLNYRTCCEYRRQLSQPEKLPKYTGYLSEYGLSRQQLELREENLKRRQRYTLKQALKATDAEMRKMHDNERAFTTWLRNKMRFPINKTRNMFDVKRRSLDAGIGGGEICGANSAVRNASGKRK